MISSFRILIFPPELVKSLKQVIILYINVTGIFLNVYQKKVDNSKFGLLSRLYYHFKTVRRNELGGLNWTASLGHT